MYREITGEEYSKLNKKIQCLNWSILKDIETELRFDQFIKKDLFLNKLKRSLRLLNEDLKYLVLINKMTPVRGVI